MASSLTAKGPFIVFQPDPREDAEEDCYVLTSHDTLEEALAQIMECGGVPARRLSVQVRDHSFDRLVAQ